MSQPYLSVIIPAYNEAERIVNTLAAAHAYLTRQRFAWELIVVLDGSQDDTLGRVRRFAAGKYNIRWIERAENRGKGYSVREGLMAASGQVRLFMDADNSTSLDHFDRMRSHFDDGCEIVICSRDPADASGAVREVEQSRLKAAAGRAGNLFIQAMLLRGIWDTQCGFKAFTRHAVETLCPACRMDRWSFDIELLALARRLDFKLGIVPANWVDDVRTHVRARSYLDVLWETIVVRWNLLRGEYDRRIAEPRPASSPAEAAPRRSRAA
jgi:dolichyl-phosphate beta-glucosyltransferase